MPKMTSCEAMVAKAVRTAPMVREVERKLLAEHFAMALELATPDFPLYRDEFLRACSPIGSDFSVKVPE